VASIEASGLNGYPAVHLEEADEEGKDRPGLLASDAFCSTRASPVALLEKTRLSAEEKP
jgi:hypothetical protein